MMQNTTRYSYKEKVLMARGLQLELQQIIEALSLFAYITDANKYAVEAKMLAQSAAQSLVDFENKRK